MPASSASSCSSFSTPLFSISLSTSASFWGSSSTSVSVLASVASSNSASFGPVSSLIDKPSSFTGAMSLQVVPRKKTDTYKLLCKITLYC